MRILFLCAEDMNEESCVHDILDPDEVDPTEPTAEERAEPPLQVGEKHKDSRVNIKVTPRDRKSLAELTHEIVS